MKKRRILKRILSLFLICCMCAEPVTVCAKEVKDQLNEQQEAVQESKESVVLAEETNEEFAYSVLNGTYISITGYTGTSTDVVIPSAIDGYTVQQIGAKAFKDSQITSVQFPDTLKTVGNYAFQNCTALTEVTFGGNETTINIMAFYGCTGLKDISFPDSLTSINSDAFSGCTGFTEIVLPDTLNYLGGGAFSNCTNLSKINYPEGLTSADWKIFTGCTNLKSITVPEGITALPAEVFQYCENFTEIILPSTLKTIGQNAFCGCTGLTEIDLPEGLEKIGDYAFYKCSGLTEIELPESVTTIYEYAFSECDNLVKINYPVGLIEAEGGIFAGCELLTRMEVPEGVITLPASVFKNCWDLKEVILPESLKTINQEAFSGCTGLRSIVLPDELNSIGKNAFYGCTGLMNVKIPDSVKTIGMKAFYGCSGFTSIQYPMGVTSAGNDIWGGIKRLTSITVPEGITSIPAYLFDGCDYVTEYHLPEGLITINDYVFGGNSRLKRIELPDSVTTIGRWAFESCQELEAVWIGENVTSIGVECFRNCDKERLVIYGVEGSYAQSWAQENNITFVAGRIGENEIAINGTFTDEKGTGLSNVLVSIFEVESLETVGETVSDENGNWSFEQAQAGKTYRIWYSHGDYDFESPVTEIKPEADVTIDSVTGTKVFETMDESPAKDFTYQVMDGASVKVTGYTGTDTVVCIPEQIDGYYVETLSKTFYQNTSIQKVKIPATVEIVDASVFLGCTSLEQVRFAGNTKVIGDSAFYGCSSLKEINFPAGITTINIEAFMGCSALKEISLPDSIATMKTGAFCNCSSLESLNYPMGLSVTGSRLFVNCTKLTEFEVPEGITKLADYFFYEWQSLKDISLPDSLAVIGNYAFYNCSSLEEIKLPEGLTEIGEYGFAGCSGFTSMALPDGVTTIGEGAFSSCTNLTSINYPLALGSTGSYIFAVSKKLNKITVPEGVRKLPDGVFQYCTYLTEVDLPDTLKEIGSNAFNGCTGLKSIELPENLDRISYKGFYDCTGLTELKIPDSVTSLGQYALASCKNLTSVNYPLNLSAAGGDIFNDNTNLKMIEVPEGVTEIPSNTFCRASYLTKITLPSTLVKINNRAFESCTGLTRLVLPENVTTIGYGAFMRCTSLTDIWIGENVTSIDSDTFYGCSTSKLVIHGVEGSYAQTWAANKGFLFSTDEIAIVEAALNGIVVDAEGKAIKDTQISIFDCKEMNTVYATVTDENGAWAYPEGEAGVTYRIWYSHADYDFATQMQEYTPDGSNVLENTGTKVFDSNSLSESSGSKFTYEVVSGNDIRLLEYKGTNTKVAIPATIDGYTVTELEGIFKNNETITTVLVPASVKKIGQEAFEGCSKLTTVRFAGQVSVIGYEAFQGCKALKTLSVPAGLEEIEGYAFANCDALKEILLPDSVSIFGSNLFSSCDNLTDVNYPMGLTVGGGSIFKDCPKMTQMTVPEGVTKLASLVFANCNYLTCVELPDTLKVIGASAFSGSKKLTEIELPESLAEIEYTAFMNCKGLVKFKLPDSVETLGFNVFEGCSALEEINYPMSLQKVNGEIFLNTTALTEITVPEGVTELPEDVFRGCNTLKHIYLPESLEKIGMSAFEDCIALEEITIPENVTYLGNTCFKNCGLITEIKLPDGLTEICSGAFSDCTALTTINYPVNVTKITGAIFRGTTSLKTIEIPEGVTTIPAYMFAEAPALRNITLPSTVQTISEYAFSECMGLSSIQLPEGVKTLKNQAFSDCDGLVSIYIPGTVETIGNYAFKDCENLENVVIASGVKEIGSYVFYNDRALESVYIPETVTAFGEEIFYNNPYMTVYCPQSSKAAVYVIKNGLKLEFYQAEEEMDTVLDRTASGYELSVEDAVAKGYITGKVKFKIKESEENVKVNNLEIKFPSNASVSFKTLELNGEPVTYELEDGAYLIPCSVKEGELTFTMSPKTDTTYSTYAVLNYTKSSKKDSAVIGIVNESIETLSIEADDTISGNVIKVNGVAPSSSAVDLYLDGEYVKTVTALKNGKYNASIELESPLNGASYSVSASASKDATSYTADTEVWYVEDNLELTRFDMYYEAHSNKKLNLLDNSINGQPISYSPGTPHKFVVGFNKSSLVESVYIKSTKNGKIQKLKADYDSVTNTYVATGYFGDVYNPTVPGVLSVEYKLKQQDPLTQNQLIALNNNAYRTSIANAATSVTTRADGAKEYVVEYEDEDDSPFGSKKVEIVGNIIEMTSSIEMQDFLDAYKMYDYYLNTESEDYWVRVIDNFVEDPKEGSPGMLIMVGDTVSNNVTTFFLKYGTGMTAQSIIRMNAVGKGLAAVGKVTGAFVDADRMRKDVLAAGYSAEKESQLLAEIELYEKTCAAYNILAGCIAVTFALNPPAAAGLYAFYCLSGAVMDSFFEAWKGSLEEGNMLFAWLIDPSGYVYEAVTSNRLEGVTTTVYYQDEKGNPVFWKAEEFQQKNPLKTNSQGVYAWDVPEGKWMVKYEMDGYEPAESIWYDVPPAQTEVHMGMVSTSAVELEYAHVYSEYAEICFTQYVVPKALEQVKLTDAEGREITLDMKEEVTGTDLSGNEYTKSFLFYYEDGQQLSGEYTLYIPEVTSYNESKLKASEMKLTSKPLQQIVLEDSYSVESGESLVVEGTIENYSGEELMINLTANEVAEITKMEKPDEDGRFKIYFKTLYVGDTTLHVELNETSVVKDITITVLPSSKAHECSWDEGVTIQPTCTEEGYVKYSCVCGNTYKDHYTSAKGHEFDDGKATTKATLTSAGVYTYTCTGCGDTKEDTISKVDKVTLSATAYLYNNSVRTPSVTVKDKDGVKLAKGVDFKVSYASGRKNVGLYTVTVTGLGKYEFTKKLTFSIKPKAPSSVKAVLYGYDDVKFSWNKSVGATGYLVYYKKASAAKFTLAGTTTNTYYKKANLSAGVKYTFKVIPYYKTKSSATKYYSASAYKTAVATTLKKVAVPTVTKNSAGKVKVKWTNIAGETGYQISKATSKTGTNIVATFATTSGKTKVVKATKGKTYYYKVRAYKTVNGKKIYGPWSAVKAYKLK